MVRMRGLEGFEQEQRENNISHAQCPATVVHVLFVISQGY